MGSQRQPGSTTLQPRNASSSVGMARSSTRSHQCASTEQRRRETLSASVRGAARAPPCQREALAVCPHGLPLRKRLEALYANRFSRIRECSPSNRDSYTKGCPDRLGARIHGDPVLRMERGEDVKRPIGNFVWMTHRFQMRTLSPDCTMFEFHQSFRSTTGHVR